MLTSAAAERVKWDYLAELEARLGDVDPGERTEMFEAILEHIRETAAASNRDTLDEIAMRGILAKIGPADDLAAQMTQHRNKKNMSQTNQPTPAQPPRHETDPHAQDAAVCGDAYPYDDKVWRYVFVKNFLATTVSLLLAALTLKFLGLCGDGSRASWSAAIVLLLVGMTIGIARAAREGYRKGVRRDTIAAIQRNFYSEIFPTPRRPA